MGPREGRHRCGATELCFGTSGIVETLIPFQINSLYFPSTPPTQPVSQKPGSGVKFRPSLVGPTVAISQDGGGASHPELHTD